VLITLVISFFILFFVQYAIIPGLVYMASRFELMFTNGFGMGFGTGTLFYLILIIVLIVWGLHYSRKNNKVNLNTAILALTFIIIGYTSYATIVIRSQANTPLNENDPSNVFALQSYLNREQYGDRPLLFGQYYNAKPVDTKEGATVYIKGENEYEAIGTKTSYVYDSDYETFFPRMHSADKGRKHPDRYKIWAKIRGDRKPTFGENLRFFFRYQIGHMYFRYFMWNFSGRQNDIQGEGKDLEGNKVISKGNWISGIPFIDNRLGPQDELPESIAGNRANNKYYMLPFLLGLIGMIFHFRKGKKDAFIVMLLFLLTGLILIIYLNQPPIEPRERDYTYAGSFYAYAIWIGLGVLGLYQWLSSKKLPSLISAVLVTLICLLFIPGIMAKENWDDHSRANKYAARDFAVNYLKSCPPNAILITNGDNDTFPLWYAQEVEGIRTDVRVVNFILASGTWYVHQLSKKLYDSNPLPLTLTPAQYKQGTREYTPVVDMNKKGIFVDLKEAINFIANDNSKRRFSSGDELYFLPTTKLSLKIDSAKVMNLGLVPPERANNIAPSIDWETKKNALYKNDLMLLDFLATNNWERPVCFVNPTSVRSTIKLEDYCQLEGFVYRLLPYKATNRASALGGINTEKTYDLYMNHFKWGNLNDPAVYVDPESLRNVLVTRANFGQLASALAAEGRNDKAREILDKCLELFPDNKVIFDFSVYTIADAYYSAAMVEKSDTLLARIMDVEEENLEFNFKSLGKNVSTVAFEKIRSAAIINQLVQKRHTIAEGYYRSGKSDIANPIAIRLLDLLEKNLQFVFGLYPANNEQVKTSRQQTLSVLQRLNNSIEMFQQEELAERGKELFNTYLQQFQMSQ
ncbi:hypothetical protein ACFLRZ_03055, partial [Bacteroidota bacterium]